MPDFFGGAAKEERVAALEADDGRVFLGRGNEERVDVVLGEETEAAALADVDELRGWRDQGEDFGADEGVVEDDVGGFEETHGLAREEVWIAGAGADEEDFAGEGGHQEAPLVMAAGAGLVSWDCSIDGRGA
jgi:hypothetical protein